MDRKSIKYLFNECSRILQNDIGLYHGWINISTSKYGTCRCYAVKNPPDDSDLSQDQTITKHYYANNSDSLHTVLSKLHEELVQWEIDGKPFNKITDVKPAKPYKWKLVKSKYNDSMYLYVLNDAGDASVYGIDIDIARNYHWHIMQSCQEISESEWNTGPVPKASDVWQTK